MQHVSTDGPARPPYVNVAFQQEEIELQGGGVLLVACAHFFFFIFSCFLKDKCSWMHWTLYIVYSVYLLFLSAMYREHIFPTNTTMTPLAFLLTYFK